MRSTTPLELAAVVPAPGPSSAGAPPQQLDALFEIIYKAECAINGFPRNLDLDTEQLEDLGILIARLQEATTRLLFQVSPHRPLPDFLLGPRGGDSKPLPSEEDAELKAWDAALDGMYSEDAAQTVSAPPPREPLASGEVVHASVASESPPVSHLAPISTSAQDDHDNEFDLGPIELPSVAELAPRPSPPPRPPVRRPTPAYGMPSRTDPLAPAPAPLPGLRSPTPAKGMPAVTAPQHPAPPPPPPPREKQLTLHDFEGDRLHPPSAPGPHPAPLPVLAEDVEDEENQGGQTLVGLLPTSDQSRNPKPSKLMPRHAHRM